MDDVGFVRVLIDQLQGSLSIDDKRIFATGISNGGMMAYRLGCELSDRIAAIAPVAGALNVQGCKPTDSISMIAFHGTDDLHVLYEGGRPKKVIDPNLRVDSSAEYSVSFWVKHNSCSPVPHREEKGNIVVQTYAGGRDGTEVTLYSIIGGGHAWPGGEKTAPWGTSQLKRYLQQT